MAINRRASVSEVSDAIELTLTRSEQTINASALAALDTQFDTCLIDPLNRRALDANRVGFKSAKFHGH